MKRASYKHGIELIALNDEPSVLDVDDLEESAGISINLLADLFEVPLRKVCEDIVRLRRKELGKDKEI